MTGGAGAIGGAIVSRLTPDHTVVILDRTGDVVVDLGDPEDDVRRAAEAVLDRYGRCDVFVHSAAMVAFGPFDEFGRPDAHRRRGPGPALRPRARLDSLHHVTAITADVATNLDFYGRLEDRRDELEQRFPVLPNPRA